MKKILVVANWKANPQSIKEARNLLVSTERILRRLRRIECVIAPPFPYFFLVNQRRTRALLGAQDAFWSRGPFTGEVSPDILKAFGVRYAIVGHSERRMHLGETDDMIGKKIAALFRFRITPILCVGERERAGRDIPEIVGDQIRRAFSGISPPDISRAVVAYEPVWALSTSAGGGPDTPARAFRAKMYIRKVLSVIAGHARARQVKILYGGSVSAGNVRAFVEKGELDGVLVGGASIDQEKFSALLSSLV